MSISLGKKLGGGYFGMVYEATVPGNSLYAVKVDKGFKEAKESLLNEDRMLRYLHQDKEASTSHIIKRIGLFPISRKIESVCLVLELLGMNLNSYCEDQANGLSLEKTRRITKQLASALSFLKKNNVIHGDIKPTNVLMSPDGESVTLTDFGSATFSEPVYNPRGREIQALSYRSPEVFLEITATEAIDVWSLAALVAEIYCKEIVFCSTDSEADVIACHHFRLESPYPASLVEKGTPLSQNIVHRSSSIKLNINQTLSEIILRSSTIKEEDPTQLMDLLNRMFVYDPEKRATPREILAHPFL